MVESLSNVDQWVKWADATRKAVYDGSTFVIKTDVTSYFDYIRHDLPFQKLQSLGVSTTAVNSLREMLRRWVEVPNLGIPQGPNASRVLANFYMTPVDDAMSLLPNIVYLRYMDDICVLARSRHEAVAALRLLSHECKLRGLALSAQKTTLLVGEEALADLADSDLDALAYEFKVGRDTDSLRSDLSRVFKKATETKLNQRRAKFSLWRLYRMRDERVLNRVLDRLQELAVLGQMVVAYLHPWLTRPKVQTRISQFIDDEERNTSQFFSTWLLAGMLEVPKKVPLAWIQYARRVAHDRNEPTFHRSLAINVLALGKVERDISWIHSAARSEHDPHIVRACLVALARIGRTDNGLTRRLTASFPESEVTAQYLKGRRNLPSLVFSQKLVDCV